MSPESIATMGSSNSAEIIKRLKEALAVSTDGQLAGYLGISRQNIGAARKRDEVPTSWIYKVAEISGCSMDWLGFGQGPRLRVQYGLEVSQSADRVASPESPYGSQGVYEGKSGGERQKGAEGYGFGAAVEMLARIYRSGDSQMINAISANINAICGALESRQREQRSAKELQDLKKRLIALEKKKP